MTNETKQNIGKVLMPLAAAFIIFALTGCPDDNTSKPQCECTVNWHYEGDNCCENNNGAMGENCACVTGISPTCEHAAGTIHLVGEDPDECYVIIDGQRKELRKDDQCERGVPGKRVETVAVTNRNNNLIDFNAVTIDIQAAFDRMISRGWAAQLAVFKNNVKEISPVTGAIYSTRYYKDGEKYIFEVEEGVSYVALAIAFRDFADDNPHLTAVIAPQPGHAE